MLVKVHVTAAKAWISPASLCLKGKRWMFLTFTIHDNYSDTGIKRVNLFVKPCLASWYSKNGCASWSLLGIALLGCLWQSPANQLSWTCSIFIVDSWDCRVNFFRKALA
jgi:hypothetical protein